MGLVKSGPTQPVSTPSSTEVYVWDEYILREGLVPMKQPEIVNFEL